MVIKSSDRRSYQVYIVNGILLIILCFFRKNQIAGVFSAIIFTFHFLFYFINNMKLVLKYIYVFGGMLLYAIGNFMCDFSGLYMVELGEKSRYVGSFCLLALLYWFSTISLLVIEPFVKRRIIEDKKYNYSICGTSLTNLMKSVIPIIVFSLGMIYWMIVIKHPSFSLNVNRFGYAKDYIPNWLYKIRTIPILLVPIVYLSVFEKSEERKTSKKVKVLFFTYLPFVIFAFWIGNKFGMFFDIVVAFLIPNIDKLNKKQIQIKKVLKLFLYIGAMMALVLFFFWYLRGNTITQMGVKLETRISQEGELWWIEVAKGDWIGENNASFSEEIFSVFRSIVTRGNEKTYGVYRLMMLYGNPSYLQYYYDMDMRLSAQGFELCFYYLGIYAFLLFPIFTNIIYSIIINLYCNAVNNRSFSSIVYLRLLFLLNTALTQGDWYRFTSIIDLALIGLLFFDIIIRRRRDKIRFALLNNKLNLKYNIK